MKLLQNTSFLVIGFVSSASAMVNVDFAEFALAPDSNYGGAGSGAGNFSSQGVNFTHVDGGASWSGFTYSNQTDTTTPGFGNQFSAYTGAGNGDANYGVSYVPLDFSNFPTGPYDPIAQSFSFSSLADINGMYVTNTTYAALSMLNGDAANGGGPGKQFGGASGDDEDFFKLIINGFDALDVSTGTVEFYLADYRFANNAQDYIIADWTFVDLSSLGDVSRLSFSIDSSDAGAFGINTPGYFAFDDISFTVVPEPSSFAFLAGLLALSWIGLRRRV